MQRAVDIDQAGPRHDVLDLGAAETARQVAHHGDVAFAARGEVGVPAFGRRRHEPAVDAVEERLAEPRSGGNHRDVAAAGRLALLQHVDLRARAAPARHTPSPADRSAAARGAIRRRRRRAGRPRATARWSARRLADDRARRRRSSLPRSTHAFAASSRGTRRSSTADRRSRVCRRREPRAAEAVPEPDRTGRAASWCRRCRPPEARISLRLTFAFILLHLEAYSSSALQSERRPFALTAPDQPGRQSLAGQLVVFTGKLSSLGRRDARALVARLGGATGDDVNAKTTMLVVGAEGFGRRRSRRRRERPRTRARS